MQTVTNRLGQVVDVTSAEVHTLKEVVENRRDCGGGTHRERKVARRELRRRGYAWFVFFGEEVSKHPQAEETTYTYGPAVHLLSLEDAKNDKLVWSRHVYRRAQHLTDGIATDRKKLSAFAERPLQIFLRGFSFAYCL